MSELTRTAADDLPPAVLMDRMLGVAEQLSAVIDRETAFLQACEPLKIVDLQEQKLRLANEYAMDVRAVTLRKDLIDQAPAEKIARLKAAMTKLDGLLKNQRSRPGRGQIGFRAVAQVGRQCRRREEGADARLWPQRHHLTARHRRPDRDRARRPRLKRSFAEN